MKKQFIRAAVFLNIMAKLVLVRHSLSEYNARGIWTGWADPNLTLKGIEDAKKSGKSLKGIRFDLAFIAPFKRNRETILQIKNILGQENLEVVESNEIRERNYGVFTGKNKWEVKKEIGDEEFQKLRRGWDYPIEKGESLKQVYERFIPFYKTHIEQLLKEGKNILIVSSGNALRTLVKYLENISDENISRFEFGLGEDYVYEIDGQGKVVSKEIRNKNPQAGKQ